jgi:hypothetical protein
MKCFLNVGIQAPEILIPNNQIDFVKWAVVACDQFTSQPEYWNTVEKIIGQSPSTYHLILPEAYLGTEKEQIHSSQINSLMEKYLKLKYFQMIDGMIYIERYFDNSIRNGLIAALDLEQYDFTDGACSLIRATEGTIIERLPPRIKIRQDALIEIPHILVLIDDPEMSVIAPIAKSSNAIELIYDFDLMQNSGHLKGFHITSPNLENKIIQALEKLISPEIQSEKYSIKKNAPPLLFAVGDGNHSLATAKVVWDKIKHIAPENHPARFALVEIVNIHDEGIVFEPIHRLLKGIKEDWFLSLNNYFNNKLDIQKFSDFKTIVSAVSNNQTEDQVFGAFDKSNFWLVSLKEPDHTLTVGSIQNYIDDLILNDQINDVDYIHGNDTILELGTKSGNAGIYLPAMRKDSLFRSVIKDGALPRKTFSMGEAHQKRFYLECKKIK